MKRIRRVTESEVIAEFLKNEFYEEEYHRDREKYAHVVVDANLSDETENGVRRALLFRRRGHMWRELPNDTQWWEVELEASDLARMRVFPRAQWRRVSTGSFLLIDIVERIRQRHLAGKRDEFITKIQSLAYRLRFSCDHSSVLLIGVDENAPLTIIEGNHRATAAMLASPDVLRTRFRVFCGLSPNMDQSCWYRTNLGNLWRYFKNRARHLLYDPDTDLERVVQQPAPVLNSAKVLAEAVSGTKAVPESKGIEP
jgi:hypothetical protein